MIARKLTIFLVALFVSTSATSVEKPTRSECIVGYALDWAQVQMDSNVIGIASENWRTREGNPGELAAMMMNRDSSRLYLQYRSRCGEKMQMAAEMIKTWRSMGLDLPTFEPLLDPIIPSPHTIDFRGPDWQ